MLGYFGCGDFNRPVILVKKADFKKAGSLAKKVGEAAYWDIYYTTGYSSMAGLGNGIANAQRGGSFKKNCTSNTKVKSSNFKRETEESTLLLGS